MKLRGILGLLIITGNLFGQTFYFGNDISYVNQMEDCGAVFKEKGVQKDVYQIFADRGTNLIRMRLWVDPTWQNSLEQPVGVKDQYSDYEDVKETIRRSKEAGMEVMLGFQLSDVWADPGRQVIPHRWINVAYDLEGLKDSVYNYIGYILSDLENDTLMPEFVKIGNENNSGILLHEYINEDWSLGPIVSSDWDRHTELYNIAIKAVRDVSDTTTIKPKITLHCADLDVISWWYNNIISRGVTDFDIMGFSYYYAWHDASIHELGNTIQTLKLEHPEYDVMVVETGYLWSTHNFDQMPNIITTPDPHYQPVIPEKQLEYMVDFTREVKRAGGNGIIFWEPAWVSTPCRTPWGQGSAHDHVVYFDPDNTNFMENGGGKWMESPFYEDLTTRKVTFKVNMNGQDVSKGVYITGTWTGEEWEIHPMANIGNNIYSYYTYISPEQIGGYYFLNDTLFDARENVPIECAEWNGTDRRYAVGDNDTTFHFDWGTCDYTTGIIEKTDYQANDILIYPNPGKNLLKIQFNSFNNGKVLQILDLNGTLRKEFSCNTNELEKTIDLSYLNPGVYLIRASDNQNFTYVKWVKIL